MARTALVPAAGAAALLLAAPACAPADPLQALDARYLPLHRDLMDANRDTARNVRNAEARGRKVKAEQARVAFFREPEVEAAIRGGLEGPEGGPARVRAEAWERLRLSSSGWTDDEKREEARLLGRLEESRARSGSWSSPRGDLQIPLDDPWTRVALAGAALPEAEREALAVEYASFQMRVIEGDLQRLIELRNEVARRQGFANGWEHALAAHGLTPADVERMVTEVQAVVAPLNHAAVAQEDAAAAAKGLARSFANLPLLQPAAEEVDADRWFDGDLAEERLSRALTDMGISTSGWEVFTGPSRYVRPGAFAFPVEPPRRVALVLSVDTRWSLWNYEALAHEGAFAIWWTHLPPALQGSPALWGPPAPWFEGFAQFFERMVTDPAFVERYVPELPAEQREALSRQRARAMLSTVNDALVRTLAERRLYEAPSELSAVCESVALQRAGLTGAPAAPAGETGLRYDPALLSPILWNYPAYSPNFLFSYMVEAWLWDAVVAQVGPPVGNPKVGPLLVQQVIQADPATPIPDRLQALLPGDRAEPLRRYLAAGAAR